MKKVLTTLFVCAMGLTALAQTNFRSISFDEALKAAKKEKKLVFIDFYTDWCGPCKKMARDVFPQTMVGDFMNAKFVNLKLNAEQEGALSKVLVGIIIIIAAEVALIVLKQVFRKGMNSESMKVLMSGAETAPVADEVAPEASEVAETVEATETAAEEAAPEVVEEASAEEEITQ